MLFGRYALPRLVAVALGVLSAVGAPTLGNSPQAGIGNNALGRIIVGEVGTLQRDVGWLLIGGGGGRGYLVVSNGIVHLNQFRAGSDNSANTPPGTGSLDIYGGAVIVTNQATIGRDHDTGILNVHDGGSFVNQALAFFNGTDTDAYLTIAGSAANASGTGVVSVASGGTLEAAGGIRIDHGDSYPAGIKIQQAAPATMTDSSAWVMLLMPYLGASPQAPPRVYVCPSEKRDKAPAMAFTVTYRGNAHILRETNNPARRLPLKLGQVRVPTDFLVLLEKAANSWDFQETAQEFDNKLNQWNSPNAQGQFRWRGLVGTAAVATRSLLTAMPSGS